jgi:pSer/pThr/pTyr-binding forkhead associated (FHA) protein
MPYRLRYLAHDLELPIGEFVVGRSTDCQLSLDDPLVSRRHAVLRVRRDGVSVEDLGSRNGVLVNGVKITGARELAGGDKVGIGSQEMVLNVAAEARPVAGAEEMYRRATQTLGAAYVSDLRAVVDGLTASRQPAPAPEPAATPARKETPAAGHELTGGVSSGDVTSPPAPKPPSHGGAPRPAQPPPPLEQPRGAAIADPPTAEASRTIQSFHLLGGVADKALAMGKAEDAERILNVLLNDVIARARDGHTIDSSVTEPAARYAARLAGATGKAAWVEYVFELYRRQRRVLPAPVIDELYSGVRKVKGLELAGVRAYVDALREMAAAFGPTERFLFQRIEGLERQMALK